MRVDLSRYTHLDLRSLSLMRIGIGLALLWTNLERICYVGSHYSDLGVVPRAEIFHEGFLYHDPWRFFAPHLLSGDWRFEAALFVLAIILASLLILGFKTDWITPLCWFLECSAQTRNPMVLHVGDLFLKIVLFWGMFLPWSRHFTLFSHKPVRNRDSDSDSDSVSSGWTAAFILQIAAAFFLAGWAKKGSAWIEDRSALYIVLNSEFFTHGLARILLPHKTMLNWVTFSVVWLERIGPLFFLWPFGRGSVRTATVWTFIVMITFFSSCIPLRYGFLAISAALIGLLPSSFWRSPTKESPKYALWRLADFVPIAILACVLFNNTSWLNGFTRLHASTRLAARFFFLHQRWGMYTPSPTNWNGWIVLPGALSDGRQIDLFQEGQALSWEKPKRLHSSFGSSKWLTYFEILVDGEGQSYYPYLGRYFCRGWNQTHSGNSRLRTIQVDLVSNYNELGGTQTKKIETLWRQECDVS